MWRQHAPAAVRLASLLAGPCDAYDIVATAFMRVTRAPGWAGLARPRAYLLRSVVNEAHNEHRRRQRRWRRDLAAITADVSPAAETDVDLIRQIARLSVHQRAVVYLTYWEDMTETAIAELLGLSAGTVHRTLDRARSTLRKALQ